MQPQDAHKIRCDYDEAIALSGYMTLDVMNASRELYKKAYESTRGDDYIWKSATGLLAVYALGFLSGSRAIKEKRASKNKYQGG